MGTTRTPASPQRAPGIGALRVALALTALSAAGTGLPAAIAPRAFYDDFPFAASWVDRLPPYNEHLVTDVGGFYVAFAILFAWAAISPRRALVVPLCIAWSVAAALHLLFHVTHLRGFDAADAIAQTVALSVVLALPLLALALVRRRAG